MKCAVLWSTVIHRIRILSFKIEQPYFNNKLTKYIVIIKYLLRENKLKIVIIEIFTDNKY